MPTTEPETWVPLEARDLVFYTREDGRFVVYNDASGTFIAAVRRRDEIWMKRTDPLTPFSALTIRDLVERERYKWGAALLTPIPHKRPYLRVA